MVGPGSIEDGRNGTGYQAEVDSKFRVHTQSVIAAGDPADGSEAQVTGGRLKVLSLPDHSARTVTTEQHSVSDTATTTIASAVSNGESMVIQNQLGGPIAIVLGTGTPGTSDLQIAAGATFVLPFPYDGVVKAKGMTGGVSGNVVVIRSRT